MKNKSSRRDFVKRSAAVAAGAFVFPTIIPSSALGLGGKIPPGDRIVCGSIGTGSQGMSNIRHFLQLGDAVKFVAVCDVDSKHLAEAKETIDATNKNSDCRTYSDFREFLEKEKLDATTKLNKVFSDVQNQLLAIPAALILVGGQMEDAGGSWTSKNIVIWLGCLVFAILMNLLIRNQCHTLQAVKQEIDQQWLQIKGKYHSVADRFESSYGQLNHRYRHQIWLIRVISLLVSISLAVSTGMLLWFSTPKASVLRSISYGLMAAFLLAIWDIIQWWHMKKKQKNAEK